MPINSVASVILINMSMALCSSQHTSELILSPNPTFLHFTDQDAEPGKVGWPAYSHSVNAGAGFGSPVSDFHIVHPAELSDLSFPSLWLQDRPGTQSPKKMYSISMWFTETHFSSGALPSVYPPDLITVILSFSLGLAASHT